MTTRTDYRDAIGWLYAHLRADWDARNALANIVEPVGLVDALTDMLLGLAAISTHGQPDKYLDYMREHIDQMLPDDMPEEDQ